MTDIFALADQLGQALAESEAYKAWQEARRALSPEREREAKLAFDDLMTCVRQLIALHTGEDGLRNCGGCGGCAGRQVT